MRAMKAACVVVLLGACGEAEAPVEKPVDEVAKKAAEEKAAEEKAAEEKTAATKADAEAFLKEYLEEYAKLEKEQTSAYWKAANSGAKEDFDASAAAELAIKKLHSDKTKYKKIQALLESRDALDPLTARSLEVAELAFKGNQLPAELLEDMVKRSSEIEQAFNSFRAELGGKTLTNNDLLEMLGKEKKSEKRKAIWEGLKQVGGAVGPKLVELAKVRNKAAETLGYANYWEMQIRLQEHDPDHLMKVFADLEKATDEPFEAMKAKLDAELAKRFGIAPEAMMPWHYDNPFFQAAPPSDEINLDEFYEKKTKEDIMALAVKFYDDIGLPCGDIVANSDLYEREGKHQHAFCIAIDREGDVRTLLNIKPTAEWMDTSLHEEGHAVYYKGIDKTLPFNLRESAHIFTTEAVAMLFGALGKNPTWMVGYAGADEKRVAEVKDAIMEQRRREQLIFARWTMVMLHFEKAMYENPDQDLNELWWKNVTRFQLLTPPPDRSEPDWASKPHFTIAPVYYHNYMLGELFAAQLRHKLAELAGHEGPAAELVFNGRKDFGKFLDEKVFRPGMSMKWPDFVEQATGTPLNAGFFGEEVK